jgi:hypothetical protein
LAFGGLLMMAIASGCSGSVAETTQASVSADPNSAWQKAGSLQERRAVREKQQAASTR